MCWATILSLNLFCFTKVNVEQWLENMMLEHCCVDAGNRDSKVWGASMRKWKTGNYTASTLSSSLLSALQAAALSGASFSVSYSAVT